MTKIMASQDSARLSSGIYNSFKGDCEFVSKKGGCGAVRYARCNNSGNNETCSVYQTYLKTKNMRYTDGHGREVILTDKDLR